MGFGGSWGGGCLLSCSFSGRRSHLACVAPGAKGGSPRGGAPAAGASAAQPPGDAPALAAANARACSPTSTCRYVGTDGVYTLTTPYERDEKCPICSAGVSFEVAPSTTLQQVGLVALVQAGRVIVLYRDHLLLAFYPAAGRYTIHMRV